MQYSCCACCVRERERKRKLAFVVPERAGAATAEEGVCKSNAIQCSIRNINVFKCTCWRLLDWCSCSARRAPAGRASIAHWSHEEK